MISLASVCYGDSRVAKHAAARGLPTNLGFGQSWLFPASSIKFLTLMCVCPFRVEEKPISYNEWTHVHQCSLLRKCPIFLSDFIQIENF